MRNLFRNVSSRSVAALFLIGALAACQSSPQPPAPVTSTVAEPAISRSIDQDQGVTFAFEPFTGAPGNIADSLSSAIGSKAADQKLSLVRRVGADATYRVNGYLSATGQPGKGPSFTFLTLSTAQVVA